MLGNNQSKHSREIGKQPLGITMMSSQGVCGEQDLQTLNVLKGLDKTGRGVCVCVCVFKWQRVRTLVSTVPSSP